jgi:transcriptional regulator with XRE-family HTH domain
MTGTKRRRWPQGAWMKLRSGKLLAGQMEARNVSQYQLAEYANCSRGFISHLIAGRKTTCTPVLAERIARALGVSVELLFVPSVSPTGQTEKPVRRGRAAA